METGGATSPVGRRRALSVRALKALQRVHRRASYAAVLDGVPVPAATCVAATGGSNLQKHIVALRALGALQALHRLPPYAHTPDGIPVPAAACMMQHRAHNPYAPRPSSDGGRPPPVRSAPPDRRPCPDPAERCPVYGACVAGKPPTNESGARNQRSLLREPPTEARAGVLETSDPVRIAQMMLF
jgi:hypothetical protein